MTDQTNVLNPPTVTEPWDLVGGTLYLDREEWGVVTDALVDQVKSARARVVVNPHSNSEVRALMAEELLRRINSHSLDGTSAQTTEVPTVGLTAVRALVTEWESDQEEHLNRVGQSLHADLGVIVEQARNAIGDPR